MRRESRNVNKINVILMACIPYSNIHWYSLNVGFFFGSRSEQQTKRRERENDDIDDTGTTAYEN
jgi:hypothetical protein